MRAVSYKVKGVDGAEFITTSYTEATNGGNRIKQVLLDTINEKTEKEKETAERRAHKVQEIFKRKRA